MRKQTFLEYIEDYNSGDIDRVLRHYDSDIVFENFGHSQSGTAVTEFLRGLLAVVENRMTPRAILIDGDLIALEADSEIFARIDLPDLPIGPMRQGERVTMRMFAIYETRGEVITHIRVAGWPAHAVG